MLSALLRAIGDLFKPPLRPILGLGVGLALAIIVALWLAVALLFDQLVRFGWRPLEWIVGLLGGVATVVVSWLLFPAIVTMVLGFFLDRVAATVEQMDYPPRPPARRAPLSEITVTTLRLMAITITLNLLALPIYLLMPGVNFFVFLGLNGYLFGREYFEVVALRRLEPATARALRARFAGRVFFGGVAIAGLFAVPVVNLVAPVIATAFMVHLFERLQPALPQPQAS